MGRRLVAVNTKICRTLFLSNATETLTRLTECYEFDNNVRKYVPDSGAVYCSLFHWPTPLPHTITGPCRVEGACIGVLKSHLSV